MNTIGKMVERDFVHTLSRPPPSFNKFLCKFIIYLRKAGVAKGSKATRLAIGWMCVRTSRRFESCPPLFHRIVGLVDGFPWGPWQATGEGSIPLGPQTMAHPVLVTLAEPNPGAPRRVTGIEAAGPGRYYTSFAGSPSRRPLAYSEIRI
jgi:hypothetical protein